MDQLEKKIKIGETDPTILFGTNDTFLRSIESKCKSSITFRNNTLTIRGEATEIRKLETVFEEMMYVVKRKGTLSNDDVDQILSVVFLPSYKMERDPSIEKSIVPTGEGNVILFGRKDAIKARSPKQLEYLNKVQNNDVVFAIGPAGTGKTYMAVAMALAALRNNEVTRIILSRPAVEAGESLGFLPGNLEEKVDPYLRPLIDAVGDMVTPDKLKSMSEKNIIEISPLAYMRGRTLNNSFIILDEAQNTTATQMKMFLTRLGNGSKCVITGDKTQIDLPHKVKSGLIDAEDILGKVKGIEFVYFDKSDVVRHRLVAEIINAYEASAKRKLGIDSSQSENV